MPKRCVLCFTTLCQKGQHILHMWTPKGVNKIAASCAHVHTSECEQVMACNAITLLAGNCHYTQSPLWVWDSFAIFDIHVNTYSMTHSLLAYVQACPKTKAVSQTISSDFSLRIILELVTLNRYSTYPTITASLWGRVPARPIQVK
jgi:hypothetical protein